MGGYLVIAGLAALLPTVLFGLLIWWLDRYEREPLRLLGVAFLWGAIPAVVLSALAEGVFRVVISGGDQQVTDWVNSSLIAPPVEEVGKALILLLLFRFSKQFDNVLDGIVYGAMVGLGFAFVENALYFLALAPGQTNGLSVGEWWTLVGLRAGLFGLNHSAFTALTGAGFGYLRQRDSRAWWAPLLGLAAAVGFHILHNGGVRSSGTLGMNSLLFVLLTNWGGYLLLLAMIVLAWRSERGWISEYLRDEVERGTISVGEYTIVGSWGARLRGRLHGLQHGWGGYQQAERMYQLITRLAFVKRKLAQGDPRFTEFEAERLRGQIALSRVV